MRIFPSLTAGEGKHFSPRSCVGRLVSRLVPSPRGPRQTGRFSEWANCAKLSARRIKSKLARRSMRYNAVKLLRKKNEILHLISPSFKVIGRRLPHRSNIPVNVTESPFLRLRAFGLCESLRLMCKSDVKVFGFIFICKLKFPELAETAVTVPLHLTFLPLYRFQVSSFRKSVSLLLLL